MVTVSARENLAQRETTNLELALCDLCASLGCRLAVQVEQLAHLKLGRLENLDLAHVDVLQRVDALARLLDFAANDFGNEFLDELLEVARRCFAGHDVEHLLANLSNLGRFGISRLLDLVRSLFGESNREESEKVAVGRSDVDVRLDECLPLANQRSELV